MALQKDVNGGGGRHGSGYGSKNMKPGYMSHIPDHHLKTVGHQATTPDRMTHQNLMSNCGGGGEEA